jgi:hypothetical protein
MAIRFFHREIILTGDMVNRVRSLLEEWMKANEVHGAILNYKGANEMWVTFTNDADYSLFALTWDDYDRKCPAYIPPYEFVQKS